MTNISNKTKFFVVFFCLCLSSLSHAGWFSRDQPTKAATQYPIVFVGGGTLIIENIGPIDYFYKIPQKLEDNGAEVFVSIISGSNTLEVRGEQLARYVEDVLAITGTEKVNLIGVSAGGPTSRYTASVYPEMVASVTTVNGGNHGIPMADLVAWSEEVAPNVMSVLIDLFDFGVGIIHWLGGNDLPQDSSALVSSMSTAGLAKFNATYPEGAPATWCGEGEEIGSNGVRYYSFAGNKAFTNVFDPIDYLLWLSASFFFKSGETSDGIISTCSSHWGKVIRDDLPLNHVDMQNHIFGITAWGMNVPNLYVQHVNRLKNMGL